MLTVSRRCEAEGGTACPILGAGLTVEDIYNWHHKNERYLRNEQSLARVAMVYSQQTASFSGGERARAKVEDHALGFYQALVEARVPFDMVHDRLLNREHRPVRHADLAEHRRTGSQEEW